MNTNLMKATKNDFEKYFFILMNTLFFRKKMKNVRKHREISFVTNRKKNKLSKIKLSYYKVFHRKFVGYINKIIQILMNKHVYLGLPILEMHKTVAYEVWFDYIKLKYVEKQMIFIKTLSKMFKQFLTLQIKS